MRTIDSLPPPPPPPPPKRVEPVKPQTAAPAPASLIAFHDHFVPAPGGSAPPPAKVPTSLPPAEQANLNDATAGKLGPIAKSNATRALQAVQGLPDTAQAQALDHLAQDPSSTDAGNIARILTSASWAQMTSAQQVQMAQVIGAVDPSAQVSTGAPKAVASNTTAAQNVYANLAQLSQDPSRMLATDSKGGTLVSSLAQMATEPLNSTLTKSGVTRQALLASTIDEVNTPTDINQSDFNTCTVTSLQYEVARGQPAEYARLMAGLVSSSGSVSTANGNTMSLDTSYYTQPLSSTDPRPNDQRSPTDVIFQSAAMNYADGGEYNAGQDVNHNPGWLFGIGSSNSEGLTSDQLANVSSALWGKGYSAVDNPSSLSGNGLSVLQSYKGSEPIYCSFTVENGKASHELAFDHIANGRVYFRNPWGDGSDLHGNGNGNTAFRDEVNAQGQDVGMVSISTADYQKYVDGMVVPSQTLPQPSLVSRLFGWL